MSESNDMSPELTNIDNLTDINPISWINRLAGSVRSPFVKNEILVHPCVINGQRALVYQRGLRKTNPRGYKRLVKFARVNGIYLKEDQRTGFRSIHHERRCKVMPMMVLGVGLFSQSVQAAESRTDRPANMLDDTISFEMTDVHAQLNMRGSDPEILTVNLLRWINDHSSFTFSLNDRPHIKRVSATRIAEIAFGGKLPKAVDVKSLNILGLYNFHDKTIYLLDSIDLNTEKGRGVLLHELVHFLQYQEGHDQDVACRNELEALAYLLEGKYLSAHAIEHSLDSNHISKISHCSG